MKALIVQIIIVVMALGVSNQALAGIIKGKVTAKGVRDNANAVVYIDKIPDKTFPAPKKHEQIDQKNLKFNPHVLPVLAGTTVDFLNSDDVLHNVFSPEKCADNFNLGSWPKGQTRSYTFKEAGCQPVILCNVHPEMAAYVVVLSTPYYAVSEKDGAYEIKDVPAGKYALKIWHEKLKGELQEVTVPESGEVKANFLIKR
jgi:plastocyanin